jgi:hypothetical protein
MSTPLQKRDGLREQVAGDELFLYDESGDELTVLNRTALLIWSLCDGCHDATQMADLLSKVYPEVPPNQILADVQSTLDDFKTQSLLK